MGEPISVLDLQNAKLDAKSLEEFANGDENKTVQARLGQNYPSAKKFLKDLTFYFNGIAENIFDARDQVEAAIKAVGPLVTESAYGGKGDGTTNNTAAFTAALNANPGAAIKVPRGVYLHNNGIVGKAGNIIMMEPGATFKAPGGDGALDFAVGSGLIGYNEGANKNVWYKGRKFTGVQAVGVGAFNDGFSPSAYMYDMRSDDADSGAAFTVNLNCRHIFGGSNTKGGRLAFYSSIYHSNGATSSDNQNRNYVGITGSAYAMTADGGTAGNEKGGYFGGGFASYADDSTQYALDICGAEFNTFISKNSGTNKYVSTISAIGVNAQRGTVIDCGIRLSGQSGLDSVYTGHIGWAAGFTFTNANGADPIFSGGSIMNTYWTNAGKRQIGRGFDLSGFAIAQEVLSSGDYMKLYNDKLLLADSGNQCIIQPNGPSLNANMHIKGRGTGLTGIGTFASNADAAIVGYIMVCDHLGNPRKVAIIG